MDGDSLYKELRPILLGYMEAKLGELTPGEATVLSDLDKWVRRLVKLREIQKPFSKGKKDAAFVYVNLNTGQVCVLIADLGHGEIAGNYASIF
jgi:hypothetical protein